MKLDFYSRSSESLCWRSSHLPAQADSLPPTHSTVDAGIVVFEAGPHQLLRGDVAEFCAAVSY